MSSFYPKPKLLMSALALAVLAVSLVPAPAEAQTNSLGISFSAPSSQIGQQTTIRLTIPTVFHEAHLSADFTATVQVCNPSCATVQTFSGTGVEGQSTLTITDAYQVGANSINAQLVYAAPSATFTGTASLTVAGADPNAPPSVSVAEKGSVTENGKVRKSFEIIYNPGNSTRTPTTFTGSCTGGQVIDTNTSDRLFECTYTPLTENSLLFVTATVSDAAGVIASSPATGLQVTIPGQADPFGTGAGDLTSRLIGGLISLVNGILQVITFVLRGVMWIIAFYIVIPLLEVTLSIDAANISTTIFFGWSIVRDLVNMIFILILIILGFATILKIEKYNYRQILVELIIMAILVNFSLVIGRIIIQIADVVQFTFLPQGEGISGVRELFKAMLSDQINTAVNTISFSASGALAGSINIIFRFAFELFVIITFAAIAVYTVIRIIALWFLLILSPFAYALRVLPATQSKAGEWWSQFLKYAFFTPIMAFFLRIAIELHSKGLALTADRSFGSGAALPENIQTYFSRLGSLDQVPLSATIELFVHELVILGFLWGGLIVASKMGVMGADAVTGLAKKGLGAPFAGAKWLGGRGVGFVGQKWNEQTQKLVSEKSGWKGKAAFAVLNPVGFFRGWGERAHERREQAREIAKGAGQEVASSFWTLGKEKLPSKELAMRKIERDTMKKLREAMGDDIDKAEARDFYKRVVDVKGLEGDLLRGAYLKLVTAQGYGDDFTEVSSSDEFADKLNIPQDQRKIYNDKVFQTHAWATVGLNMDILKRLREEKGFEYGREYKDWIEKDDTQNKLRNLAELTNPAKDIGHYEQMYTAVRDEKLESDHHIKASFRPVIDSEYKDSTGSLLPQDQQKHDRTEMILGETVKIPIRDFMRQVTWHNLIPKMVNEKGEWDLGRVVDAQGKILLTPYQIGMLKKLGPEYIDQATHMQARTVKYTIGQWTDEDGNITDRTQFEAFRNINDRFVDVLKNIATTGRARDAGQAPTPPPRPASPTPPGGGS